MPVYRGADRVRVRGLDELRRELRRIDSDGEWRRELRAANYDVAKLVVRAARLRAMAVSRMARSSAETLRPGRQEARAVVRLGDRSTPYAMGAEFGAYQNKRRAVKTPQVRTTASGRVRTVQTRATLIRDDESIARVINRIQSQYVDTRGRNVGRRGGGTQVTVRGIRLGWNQFKPWRGNSIGAGYFLFPSIRAKMPEIIDTYGDAIDDITRKAFPD